MRDVLLEKSLRQDLAAALPEDLDEAERMAASIEARIQTETHGEIRDLSVKIHGSDILLQGRCPSFYSKQRAQEAAKMAAARMAAGHHRVHNAIEVG